MCQQTPIVWMNFKFCTYYSPLPDINLSMQAFSMKQNLKFLEYYTKFYINNTFSEMCVF